MYKYYKWLDSQGEVNCYKNCYKYRRNVKTGKLDFLDEGKWKKSAYLNISEMKCDAKRCDCKVVEIKK